MRIYEVKRHIDGSVQRYTLELVLRRPHIVVARYGIKRTMHADGFTIPRGSRTYGFFWRRRPYIMYRLLGPNDELIAHRFDVVEDVRLEDNAVSYTDLLLDLWVHPDGTTQVEDEDEVAEAAREGFISKKHAREIGRVRDLLLRRHRAIVREGVNLIS